MKTSRKVLLSGTEDLFRSRLENITDLRHALVRLAGAYCEDERLGIANRMMVGWHLLSTCSISSTRDVPAANT